MNYTIKVVGLRELIARGDAAADKTKKRLVREGLRDAVQPTRLEAARLLAPYSPKSAAGYRVVVRKTGVVAVQQRYGKTTGQHPEFARLQFRRSLLPGFQHTYALVVANLQRQVDRIGKEFVGT